MYAKSRGEVVKMNRIRNAYVIGNPHVAPAMVLKLGRVQADSGSVRVDSDLTCTFGFWDKVALLSLP